MQQIIYFFQKFKYFLFFLLLELIAVSFIFNNLNFHKSKFVNSANSFTGGLYKTLSNYTEYLHLQSNNNILSDENTRLKNILEKAISKSSMIDFIIVDSTKYMQKYIYTEAKIINNNYSKPFNFLTLNKGKRQKINKEMAVINSKGIIGITEKTSNNYARVQSILSKNSNINARIKGNTFYGTLKWDGVDYNRVQLHDIERQAPIKIGDTIETGGKSTIFPEGIPIGTVLKLSLGNTADNKIDVKLFNDMSNLRYVYVVKNIDKEEILSLENMDNE